MCWAPTGIVMDAFYTDVRADLAQWREGRGLPADPMRAFAESGYQARINAERVGGRQAGWGVSPVAFPENCRLVAGFGPDLCYSTAVFE